MKEVKTLTWSFGLRKELKVTLEDGKFTGAVIIQEVTSSKFEEIFVSPLELLALESAIKELKHI